MSVIQNNTWGNIPHWALDSINALLEALKSVEPTTYEHSVRVGELSRQLSRDAGFNDYEQKLSFCAGLLHDIGKIGISKDILLKSSKLDPIELDIMQNHSVMSENIVKPLSQNMFFNQLLPLIRGHHERMDGHGYPDKKRGDEIPALARVVMIVDAFDAMSENRVYRKGLPIEIVFAELQRCSGTQFDNQLVKTFIQAQPFWSVERENDIYKDIIRKIA